MANRRQSLAILIVYFIIFTIPTLLTTLLPKLGSQIFVVETIDYLLGAVILVSLAAYHSEPNTIEMEPKSWTRTIYWGVLGAILVTVGQIVILQVTQLLGQSAASANTTELMTVGRQYPIFFLAILVGAPIMEEIVFRKVIFGSLTPVTGTVGAAVISSLFFALAHADGHLILYAFIGLLFCWLYRQTGRIATSMIAHILMNIVAVLFSLLSIK